MKSFITYNANSCLPLFENFVKNKQELKMIDIGGKNGVLNEYKPLTKFFSYTCMEYDKSFSSGENRIYGDITNCDHIANESYDLVFSTNTLEHVTEPWNAVKNMVRILKPNSLMFIVAPFTWRYHEHPIDYWRFTPPGLEYLVNLNKNMNTIINGYWCRTDSLSLYIGKKYESINNN